MHLPAYTVAIPLLSFTIFHSTVSFSNDDSYEEVTGEPRPPVEFTAEPQPPAEFTLGPGEFVKEPQPRSTVEPQPRSTVFMNERRPPVEFTMGPGEFTREPQPPAEFTGEPQPPAEFTREPQPPVTHFYHGWTMDFTMPWGTMPMEQGMCW